MDYPILKGFSVLEGIDGSGTTTQLEKIDQLAVSQQIRLFTSCEPTESPIGKAIRLALKGEYTMTQESLARLFSADRSDHIDNINNGILYWLSKGYKVLSDRYLFSSLVYQSINYSFDEVLKLNPFPLPEILFYIDTPPEVGIKRRSSRDIEEIYEKESLQKTIYDSYKRVIDYFHSTDMKTVIIDGTLTVDQISQTIWSYLK